MWNLFSSPKLAPVLTWQLQLFKSRLGGTSWSRRKLCCSLTGGRRKQRIPALCPETQGCPPVSSHGAGKRSAMSDGSLAWTQPRSLVSPATGRFDWDGAKDMLPSESRSWLEDTVVSRRIVFKPDRDVLAAVASGGPEGTLASCFCPPWQVVTDYAKTRERRFMNQEHQHEAWGTELVGTAKQNRTLGIRQPALTPAYRSLFSSLKEQTLKCTLDAWF